jgi:uncharacterized membrane protein
MTSGWRSELPHWALLAGMFGMAAWSWPTAPDRIPVHWNAAGEVDRYGGRFEGIVLLPLIGLGLYLLLRFLPRIDPARANYALFEGAYRLLRFSVLALLVGVYVLMQLSLRGHEAALPAMFPVLLGQFFVVLGAIMGKLRPNWFVGIRTPWTLSSPLAWNATHRVGGWFFMLWGLLILGVGALHPAWLPGLILGGAVTSVLGSFGYSYWVYRQDPHPVPAVGSPPADDTGDAPLNRAARRR